MIPLTTYLQTPPGSDESWAGKPPVQTKVNCGGCKHWDQSNKKYEELGEVNGRCQRIHCTTNDFNDDKQPDASDTIGIITNDGGFSVVTHKDFGCALFQPKTT